MSQQDSSAPTSKLAIGALASVFFCPPFALIFAIIALVRITASNGRLGGKTIAIVAICLNLATIPVVAILAAIAVPSFVKYQCKSKQSEAKTNLRALAVQQAQFLAVRVFDRTLATTYEAVSSETQSFPSRVTKLLDADGILILEYVDDIVVGTHPGQVLADCQAIFGG